MKNLFLFLFLIFCPFAYATEIMTPDTPIPADPQNRPAATSVHIGKIVEDYDNAVLEITVSNGSIYKVFNYYGASATTLLNAQNKMDFSGAGNSRNRKIFQQLNSDGKLTGTISGSPD